MSKAMDDLEELQSRVAAAQEKLRLSADDQRKYGLRLNDVVAIVEGSLARQQEEMKRLQAAALELRIERDTLLQAEAELKSSYEAAQAKLTQHQAQNEQLRAMVLTLLNVIEGREPAAALQNVMLRLETSLKQLSMVNPSRTEADVASVAPFPASVLSEIDSVETEAQSADIAVDEPVADHADASEAIVGDDLPDDAEDAVTAAEQKTFADLVDATEAAATQVAVAEEMPDDAEDAGLDAAAVEPELAEHDMTEEPLIDAASTEIEAPAAEAGIAPEIESSLAESTPDEMLTEFDQPEAAEAAEVDHEHAAFTVATETDDVDLSADQPEDLASISMTDHESLVADPELPVQGAKANGHAANDQATIGHAVNGQAANGHAATGHEADDEPLVSALLDAEKALIEAGANGFNNGNSPVAEIIRRISLRTREFSEASGS